MSTFYANNYLTLIITIISNNYTVCLEDGFNVRQDDLIKKGTYVQKNEHMFLKL